MRDSRQQQVHDWCAAAFGDVHANSVTHRAIRMCEEAIEACQSAGGERMMIHRLVDYVFDRPPGELSQEIGGVGLTLLALCHAAGLSAESEEERELARVLSKPLEHFRERNQAKNDAGFLVDGNSFSQNKAIRATFPDPGCAVVNILAAESDALGVLKAFQRDTINILADRLVREAARLERTSGTVRIEDLKREAQALRDYAETLAPAAPEANR